MLPASVPQQQLPAGKQPTWPIVLKVEAHSCNRKQGSVCNQATGAGGAGAAPLSAKPIAKPSASEATANSHAGGDLTSCMAGNSKFAGQVSLGRCFLPNVGATFWLRKISGPCLAMLLECARDHNGSRGVQLTPAVHVRAPPPQVYAQQSVGVVST